MGSTELLADLSKFRVDLLGLVVFVLRASELFMVVELLNGLSVLDEDLFDLLLDVAGQLLGLVALILLLHC